MQLTPEQEQAEKDNGDLLASIANVDGEIARRVLRKHNGDMEKAADALFAGDRAEVWETKHRTTPEQMYLDGRNNNSTSSLPALAPLPSTSVIDLTADDDDINRAIQMSMQESSQQTQSQPHFGPSERAPHPEWQMVRSNAPVTGSTAVTAAHDDHTLNEAIQASLQDFKEDTDVSPFKETIREGGRPIALRTDTRALAYAALVVQALYFVPQVRATVSNLRLPSVDPGTGVDHPDRSMWNLIELFTNMDLAQLSAIIDNELLPSLEIPPFDGTKSLGEASSTVVKSVAFLIEQHLKAQAAEGEEPDRLFSFTHGQVTLTGNHMSQRTNGADTGMVVTVEFGQDPQHNDLNSCISDTLTRYTAKVSHHDVIIKPSEVITFDLKRLPVTPSTGSAPPDSFSYPKTIYLDQFLFDNLALANSKRRLEREMLEEIKELMAHKEALTRSEGRDALQNLRSTIDYYENVADPEDDLSRKRTLQGMADRLKDIMTVIEGKVEHIDHKIETLQADLATVFDCPELQECQYDLRSVLVHSGLPGRKQMYSYVQDTAGVWWKTVDHEVTEVPEETVLTDPTGLHLGAGPYMLFYSRHLSEDQINEPLVWPSMFSGAVEENNKKFLAMMHPELEIFSHSRTSSEVIAPLPLPLPRELPTIPQEGLRRPVSRENSRSMSVDEMSQQQ
ncbi:hypothetical protein GALMADRAFT_155717 [Galerina marginata CBS 339.88]|uniref:USP domain-containing protein n=1 Tax=Galerina marginata (strain CBS 339.88) TaxID=685588 RepID=A0A067T1J8_GALM3|nr:hypothetical protein GALMADRAFT_155717 [Galerina marginata CBS 339.88]